MNQRFFLTCMVILNNNQFIIPALSANNCINNFKSRNCIDSFIAPDVIIKKPAAQVSISNTALYGLPAINGVTPGVNNRILLIGQTNQQENGLWLAQLGAWIRPWDFYTGAQAGRSFIQIIIMPAGSTIDSQWICSSSTSIIDTDPITFAPCNYSDQLTAANVGTGTGQFFRDKTGNTLNFKTLAVGAHLALTNNTNDIMLGTDAATSNSGSTIVARDALGNFSAGSITASLTGAASLNVLKAGDIMTGALTLPIGSVSAPSLNFTGSVTSGISFAGGSLSFDITGTERLKIGSTIQANAPLVLKNVQNIQSTQSVAPTTNGSITTASTTGLLLLKHTANITNFTVRFPPNPVDGQVFTILLGTSNTISLINVGGTGGASVINAITSLNPGSALAAATNGTSVTYFYSSVANSWYRFLRG